MYVDQKKKRWPLAVLAMVLLLAAAGVWKWIVPASGQDLSEEGAAALRAAVERSALQCYVVEGVYPPSLSYLEENYGLQVNSAEYEIVYDIYASNLPPAIRVIKH